MATNEMDRRNAQINIIKWLISLKITQNQNTHTHTEEGIIFFFFNFMEGASLLQKS